MARESVVLDLHGARRHRALSGASVLGRGAFPDGKFRHLARHPHVGREQMVFSLGAGWADNMLLALYLVLVLAAAALVYRFVEAPTREAAASISHRIWRGGSARARSRPAQAHQRILGPGG